MKLTGTDHRIASAYHPQTNGLIERFNRTLQDSLRKCCTNCEEWDLALPSVLFAIRTCFQKSTKYSPFELMFNRWLKFFLHDFFRKPILPIEMELKCVDIDDNNEECSVDYNVEVDEVVARLSSIRKLMFDDASDNIKKSQKKYKDYHDSKITKPEVK